MPADDKCACGAAATQWCHSPCCSGETGFCDYCYAGTRHERMQHFGQLTGNRLPDDVAGCDREIGDYRAQLGALPAVAAAAVGDRWGGVVVALAADERERRAADLRLVIALLQQERAALLKMVR